MGYIGVGLWQPQFLKPNFSYWHIKANNNALLNISAFSLQWQYTVELWRLHMLTKFEKYTF